MQTIRVIGALRQFLVLLSKRLDQFIFWHLSRFYVMKVLLQTRTLGEARRASSQKKIFIYA